MLLDSTGGVCKTESECKALSAIGSSGNLSRATYRGKSDACSKAIKRELTFRFLQWQWFGNGLNILIGL